MSELEITGAPDYDFPWSVEVKQETSQESVSREKANYRSHLSPEQIALLYLRDSSTISSRLPYRMTVEVTAFHQYTT